MTQVQHEATIIIDVCAVSYSVQHACIHAHKDYRLCQKESHTLKKKRRKKTKISSTQAVFLVAQKQLFQHFNLACVQMPRIYCNVTFSKAGGRAGRVETRVNLSLCVTQRPCMMALYPSTFRCTLVYTKCLSESKC